MSEKGIRIAANIFSAMQESRRKLLKMGTTVNDHQDIRLAQMLEDGKDAMWVGFCKITTGKRRGRPCRRA